MNSLRAVNSRLKANGNSRGRDNDCFHCHTYELRLFCKRILQALLQSLSPSPPPPLSLSVFCLADTVGVGNLVSFLPCPIFLPVLFFLLLSPFLSISLFPTGQSMELKAILELKILDFQLLNKYPGG